ncbi:MAG TPA: Hsp20/alpha crystallin family protein [Candidatus Dormibacteraeota bacterium]|nr:Hsp20/alpha crystallin family protein [Candidatus Dormibacteraeota bacterium]
MDFVLRPRLGHFEPNADVVVDEERGQVVVAIEVAGADPQSLHVSVDERYLLISGRRSAANRLHRGSFVQKEISYGDFAKRIALPVAVDYGEVVASYTDGVLVIALPIAATAYLPTTRTEIRLIVKRTHS